MEMENLTSQFFSVIMENSLGAGFSGEMSDEIVWSVFRLII